MAERLPLGAPLYRNEPSGAWPRLNLRDVLAHRDLLYFLAWRDIKVRYKQTLLGAAWAIAQPLFTALVFAVVFGKLARVPSDGIPYPLFAYAGLLPWVFFSGAVNAAGQSLVGNANLLTKVYFPRLVIPCASVAGAALDFALGLIVLVGLLVFYGVAPTWRLLLLPPLFALTALIALGVGVWLSALNVKYRDVRHALPFALQLWLFATPVIYPASLVPVGWRRVLLLNPLTGIVENFRAALFPEKALDWAALAASAAVATVVLVCAAYSFRRMERSFADLV